MISPIGELWTQPIRSAKLHERSRFRTPEPIDSILHEALSFSGSFSTRRTKHQGRQDVADAAARLMSEPGDTRKERLLPWTVERNFFRPLRDFVREGQVLKSMQDTGWLWHTLCRDSSSVTVGISLGGIRKGKFVRR